jgi:general secretion pathway protein A
MMFTDHFNLSALPFSENPPIDQLLTDKRAAEALARLQFFSQDGEIALVTGATGLGKSSILRLFQTRLSPTKFLPVYVHITNLRASSLLKFMLAALGEDPPTRGKERLFLQIFDRARHSEQTLIFLIDDAHLISPDGLTDLRLLVSSVLEDRPPIKVLLSGQDSLLHALKRPSHLDLLHRVCVRYHIRAMSQDETLCYIDARLKAVDAHKDIFHKDAKILVHDYSGGVLRLINRIATNCLFIAASSGLQSVSEDLVHQAITEFKLP